MLSTVALDRGSATPLYQQIAEQIKAEIAGGRLPPGAQLPTVRQLASALAVTRLTVQSAYAELQSAGWVEATVGRGTFVGAQAPVLPRWSTLDGAATPAAVLGDLLQMGQAPALRSMASASPDPTLFPEAEFWAALEEQRQHTTIFAGYGPAQGDALLRIELAAHLATRGLAVAPDDVLVVAGVTQGLALAALALAQPGDSVLVEQPTYVGFLHLLRAQGLQPIPVALDGEGPRLDVIEHLATLHRIRFFYTIPSFQNPTGACATSARKAKLLELAERFGFFLVEDDLYGLMAYDAPPPAPLKTFDRTGRVVYVTSFSKTLMPGLRLGLLVAPPALRERLTSLRMAADLGSPLLLQRVLATFLRRGDFRRHLQRVLPIYRARRDATLHALDAHMPPAVTWTRPQGGFSCWLTLPRRHHSSDLPRLAARQGFTVAPGNVFLTGSEGDHFLRISFGGLPVATIHHNIEQLSHLVRDQLSRAPLAPAALDEWTPLV